MAGTPDSDLDDVARIRRVLARELETINEYEAFARASSAPEVRAFFLHLASEEKEHVSEAVHMLRLLDNGQDAHFTKPFVAGHFEGTAAQGAPIPTPPAVSPPAPSPASVIGRNGRLPSEPPTSVPPQRLMYGLPAPPPAVESHPLTVGSLRRGGGGGSSGR
ncbi:ferritin family protein [Pyxidicoccus xibeiensis]|uniref:ferritin family protein n=1 Tax=Pyxidicoccus xibeiensis TaxID=2906759 RepID=UPI0020A795AE|nr:ferritin [Pyxidicoccus xibeiensis]MCP3142009.1 ferritin [Pyxidicoccus xibeiensis]